MRSRRRRNRDGLDIVLPGRLRRRIPFLLVLAVLSACVVYDRAVRPVSTGDDYARYHERDFRVTRVVDGDTLDIDAPDLERPHTRIRLWGVDTPEVKHGGQPAMHFGPEAATFADRTLAGRSIHVVLAPDDTRDKYGRLLAYVYLDRGQPMFNELLLEEGLAFADPRFPHPYRERFQAIEAGARRRSLGLWADLSTDKMPRWRQRRERSAKVVPPETAGSVVDEP